MLYPLKKVNHSIFALYFFSFIMHILLHFEMFSIIFEGFYEESIHFFVCLFFLLLNNKVFINYYLSDIPLGNWLLIA